MISDIVRRQLRGAVLLAAMMSFVQSMMGEWTGVVAVAVGAIGLYYLSFACHEAGHFVVARFLGATPVVTMVGVESRPANRTRALWISLAGPVCGATVPLGCLGITSPMQVVGLRLTAVVLAVNHIAMLLPVFPDGQILKREIFEEKL